MIAVDTNVLVRALVDDPDERAQVEAARIVLKSAGEVFLPQVVQVEMVWVLETAYGLKHQEVLRVLDALAVNSAYVFEREDHFSAALAMFRQGKADFADYLILAAAHTADVPLATLNKRLARSEGVHLLAPGKSMLPTVPTT
ncbi:MAG: hypothetical protein BWK76_06420 [Desulfobulbaceae bacterium A2]|nr:MAG: hypothetical protein BWK76_06420 [Desulfobulbaceae bacterium A2]